MSKAKPLERIRVSNQPKGPIKIKSPDLSAKGNNVAIEEIQISQEGIELEKE